MYKGNVKKKKLKENFDGFCLLLQTSPGDVTLQRNQKETAATQAIKTIINLLTAVNTTLITVCSLTGAERQWVEDYTGWSDFVKELRNRAHQWRELSFRGGFHKDSPRPPGREP